MNKTLLHTFQSIKEVLVMQRQKYFINSYRKEYIEQQKGVIGQTVCTESPDYSIEGGSWFDYCGLREGNQR